MSKTINTRILMVFAYVKEYWWYLHSETSIDCGFESVRMKFILYLFNKLLDVATLYLIVRKTNGRDCVVVLCCDVILSRTKQSYCL